MVAKPAGSLTPRGGAAGAAAAGPAALLDPRGAFLLQGPTSLTIWEGSACPEPFLAAAQRFAAQLHKYEAAPAPPALVQQGREPPSFWTSLAHVAAGGDGGGSRSGSPAAPGTAAASVAAAADEMLAAVAGGEPVAVAENSAYDRDFEVRGAGWWRAWNAANGRHVQALGWLPPCCMLLVRSHVPGQPAACAHRCH